MGVALQTRPVYGAEHQESKGEEKRQPEVQHPPPLDTDDPDPAQPERSQGQQPTLFSSRSTPGLSTPTWRGR